jgi:rod shape-determining protein MreD
MIISTLLVTAAGVACAVIQSTILAQIVPLGVVPDLALVLLAAASWRHGSLSGEIAGFIIGLSFDALGLAPLGVHASIFTLTGYLFGRMQGSIAPGRYILPAVAAGTATLIKYTGSFLLSLVFGLNSAALRHISLNIMIELLANMLFSPLLFLLAAMLAQLSQGRRGGFR